MDIAIRVLVDQLLSQPDGLPLFWQIVLAICLPLALMMSVQALMQALPQLKLALFWLSVAIALLSVLANSWDLRNLLDLLPGLHRGSPFDDHGRF